MHVQRYIYEAAPQGLWQD